MKMLLHKDHTLVLQQINDLIEEDFAYLARSLHFSYARLARTIQDLHRMGLVASRNSRNGLWLRLSAKGKKIMQRLTPPELQPSMAAA